MVDSETLELSSLDANGTTGTDRATQMVRKDKGSGEPGGGSLLTMPGLQAFNAAHEAERRKQLEVRFSVVQRPTPCLLERKWTTDLMEGEAAGHEQRELVHGFCGAAEGFGARFKRYRLQRVAEPVSVSPH